MASSTNISREETPELLVARLAQAGRAAQRVLARLTDAQKAAGLRAAAEAMRVSEAAILAANALDVAAGEERGLSGAMLDRLRLDSGRLAGICDALDQVAALPDPVGEEISRSQRPNGLVLSRVRVPIGLIGIIYESRPNVTADAAALCLRSGNAVLLRGGSGQIAKSVNAQGGLCARLKSSVISPSVASSPIKKREAA